MQPQQPYQPSLPPQQPPSPPPPQAPTTDPGQPAYGTPPVSPAPPAQPHPDYEFIMNPPKRQRASLFGGGTSMTSRIAVMAVGLLVLVIIFAILKSLFSGGSNVPQLTSVLEEQQEIIHLTQNPTQTSSGQQVTLSTNNQNFAITAQLSIGSAQTQLITYLKNNGHKVGSKQLQAAINSSVDKELEAAATAATYDQTYTQVMQQRLTIYEQRLSAAYKVTTGPKGRALLTSEYKGAQLLLKQLSPPATSQ